MISLTPIEWAAIAAGVLALLVVLFLIFGRRQRISLGDEDRGRTSTLERRRGSGKIQGAIAVTTSDLVRIKGLGPRAAAALEAKGIASIAQLAAIDDEAAALLDRELGTFAGRLGREQWVEQARLLESGDLATYEARFGRLGVSGSTTE